MMEESEDGWIRGSAAGKYQLLLAIESLQFNEDPSSNSIANPSTEPATSED